MSAASRSAGDGSTPSSRRRVSSHTATCRSAAGQRPQGGMAQPGLDHRRDPVPLHHQPGLEGRAAGDAHAVEQLAVQLQQARGVVRPAGEGVQVDGHAVALSLIHI